MHDDGQGDGRKPGRRRAVREQTPTQRALGLLTRRDHSRKELTRKLGRKITVTAVCARSRSRDRGIDTTNLEWFDDPVALAKSDGIDLFVELIGGEDGPALAAVKAAPDPPPAVVIDAALLFEAGWDKLCDKIIFVDAPRDVRLERAVRRGWSAEQFAAREAAQLPPEEKRQRSHIVIRNVRTVESLREVVRLTWRNLVGETNGN